MAATTARRIAVVPANTDRLIWALLHHRLWHKMASHEAAVNNNNAFLSVSGDRPASGHHPRTWRGYQRSDSAYGCAHRVVYRATAAKPAKNNHNGFDNAGAARRTKRKVEGGDDVRAAEPPSCIDGRGGTPWGPRERIKTIVYRPPSRTSLSPLKWR